MDWEDFEITQEDLINIENIEVSSLINSSFSFNFPSALLDTEEEENIIQLSDLKEDDIILPTKRRRRQRILSISSNTSSDTEEIQSNPSTFTSTTTATTRWNLPRGDQRTIVPFTEFPGLSPRIVRAMIDKSPEDFYILVVPEHVFEMIAEDTNIYKKKI